MPPGHSFRSAAAPRGRPNERLLRDSLPVTIAFMSLSAAQIRDRISGRTGLALLAPILVVYWILTEHARAGNVLPCVVLQSCAVTALLLIVLARP